MRNWLEKMLETIPTSLAVDIDPWLLLMLFPLIGALILSRQQGD